MNRNIQTLFLGIGFAISGCSVTPAVAPKSNLEAVPLKKYEQTRLEFVSNTVFLWPQNVTSELMGQVMKLSDEKDATLGTITSLGKRVAVLEKRLKENGTDPKAAEKEAREIGVKIGPLNEDLVQKNRVLNSKQDELAKARANSNSELVSQLENEVKTLEDAVAGKEKEVSSLKEKKLALEKRSKELEGEEDYIERNSKAALKESLVQANTKKVGEISKIVSILNPPESVIVDKAEDGSPTIEIFGWEILPGSSAMDFSSKSEDGKKPTIESITFVETGGIYEFRVKVYEDEEQTQLVDEYLFKLMRVDSEGTRTSISLSGEITRLRKTESGTPESFLGFAKLVDSEN